MKTKNEKIKTFKFGDKLINHRTEVNKNNNFIQELSYDKDKPKLYALFLSLSKELITKIM